MNTRIVIDDQDADEEGAETTPFTLNVYRDADDGTPGGMVEIGNETCLIGDDVPSMLRRLAEIWEHSALDARDRSTLTVETL